MSTKMPNVLYCNVNECAYNAEDSCHAMAITVDNQEAMCDTFFNHQPKGGIRELKAGVGACKSDGCVHNRLLECTAPGIKVSRHNNKPACDTFSTN